MQGENFLTAAMKSLRQRPCDLKNILKTIVVLEREC